MFYGFEEGITAIVGFQGGLVFVGEMERANSANCCPVRMCLPTTHCVGGLVGLRGSICPEVGEAY